MNREIGIKVIFGDSRDYIFSVFDNILQNKAFFDEIQVRLTEFAIFFVQ